MPTRPLPTIALTFAAVAASACQPKDSARPAETATAASPDANVLRVTAADYAFAAPDQIQGGLTTIRLINQGPSLHHIQLVKLDQGKTLPDFLTALKDGGPPPAWATMVGGPNPPVPGDSTTVVLFLDPGSYAMICLVPAADGVPHFAKGMARMLTVTGPARITPEPAADVTVKLVDYDFQFSQPLTPGHHTIRVENDGQQWHELVLLKLHPGKTPMDFAEWAAKPIGAPPGDIHGGISGIVPGTHGFIITDLTPGDYGLICFFPDVKDGKPHLEHGMIKAIKVG
jgi:hypothetical protein